MSWRLFLDIGNFAVKYGARVEGRWQAVDSVPHEFSLAEDDEEAREMSRAVLQLLLEGLEDEDLLVGDCSGIVISCTVDCAGEFLRALRAALPCPTRELTIDLAKGFTTKYRRQDLGMDRLANVVAAKAIYPLPALVIDCGSCLTCELIGRDGTFLGGNIAAGMPLLTLSLVSLSERLCQAVSRPILDTAGLIGRNTAHAIASGLALQAIGTIREFIDAAYEEFDTEEASVIFTGGDAEMLHEMGEFEGGVNAMLTLEGMRLLDGTE